MTQDKMRIVVLKNGEVKLQSTARIESDGSIRVPVANKWMPVVNSDACKALRLDPKAVARAEAPVEALARMGDNGCGLLVLTDDEWDAIQARKRAEAEAALEAAVPGIAEAIRLSDAAYNEQERYRTEFNAMMEDEYNDGARPPQPENRTIGETLAAHLSSHPRAALYLTAKHQDESSHWADNSGKGAAAKRAMQILVDGGSLEDAKAALAVRREFID